MVSERSGDAPGTAGSLSEGRSESLLRPVLSVMRVMGAAAGLATSAAERTADSILALARRAGAALPATASRSDRTGAPEPKPTGEPPEGPREGKMTARVLTLIRRSPAGISLPSMGKPLGTTWQSLIPIVGELLKKGALKKEGNRYYAT